MPSYSRRQMLAGSVALALHLVPTAWGQERRARPKADSSRKINTQVSVELITTEGAGIDAQEWATIFEELNVPFTVRRSLLKEKPETTETTAGISLRDVQVLGRLERDGSITFADRRFTTSDAAKIRDWVNGLKAYGAQGSPKGQPLWGLSKAQFDPLFQALSPPLSTELQKAALNKALDQFTVRRKYPLRFSAEATQHLERDPVRSSLQQMYAGLSEGTALAASLNEFDLGFYPQRTPAGKLELAIVPLKSRPEVWPVGWPLVEDPPKVAPELYKSGEVELHDEPLADVLHGISDLIKVPVLIDEYGLKSTGIDFPNLKVSHKPKKTIWSAALKHVCFQARCKWELRVDEAGHPILWIMSAVPPKDEAKPRKR